MSKEDLNNVLELIGGIRSINKGEQHEVSRFVGDDEPCYYQRQEWIEWILDLADEAETQARAYEQEIKELRYKLKETLDGFGSAASLCVTFEQEIKELKDLLRLISNRIVTAQTANNLARSVQLQSIVRRIIEVLGDE